MWNVLIPALMAMPGHADLPANPSAVRSNAHATKVEPGHALRDAQQGLAVLIDVREPDEVKQGQIKGALTFPTSKLGTPEWDKFVATLPHKPVYTYCAKGGRAEKVAEQLRRRGFEAKSAGGYDDLKKVTERR